MRAKIRKISICSLVTFSFFFVLSPVEKVQGRQDVIIDQTIVQTAKVTNPGLIKKIISISLIPEDADLVKSITFIDANNNGFGSDDYVLIHPQGKSYDLMPSAELTEIMNNWPYKASTQLIGGEKQNAEYYENIPETDPETKATNYILASLLRGLDTNYGGTEMKIYFERGEDGTYTLNMWGYDTTEDALQWQKPRYPPGGYVKNYDIFRVQRTDRDTLFIDNTTLYDQIYIYHNVVDTVFIAPDSAKSETLPHDVTHQPGLLPPAKRKQRRDR
jgi:hypothetical protein